MESETNQGIQMRIFLIGYVYIELLHLLWFKSNF